MILIIKLNHITSSEYYTKVLNILIPAFDPDSTFLAKERILILTQIQ